VIDASGVGEAMVGGVPAYFAAAPGDTHVGLIVGVGAVDEPLALRGVTHLCEHLILSQIAGRDLDCNGEVGVADTQFIASGSVEQTAAFLNGVAGALRVLPTERFDKELAILQLEADRDEFNVLDLFLTARFGAQSYGRAAKPEFALLDIDVDRARAWAVDHFPSAPAALWVVGPDPVAVVDRLEPGLLPARRAATACPASPRVGRRAVVGDVAGPGVSFVVCDTTANKAAIGILQEELEHEIRQERALAYGVGASHTPLRGGITHVCLGVDTTEENRPEVVRVLHDEFVRFADHGPSPPALTRYVTAVLKMMSDPAWSAQVATNRAVDHVAGVDSTPASILVEEVAALTVESVAGAFRQALDTGLALVPPGTPPLRLFPYDPPAVDARAGPVSIHRGRRAHRQERLALGGGFVTWWGDRTMAPLQVGYASCELVIAWDNGDRILVDADGSQLLLEPSHFRDGESVIAAVDNVMSAAPRLLPDRYQRRTEVWPPP
jgi:hypothetical protein